MRQARSELELVLMRSITLVVSLLVAVPVIVRADQADARLKGLFVELNEIEDGREGTFVTNRIWAIWREHESIDIELLMHRGFIAMQRGELTDALTLFDRVVIRAPGFAEGWNMRATVHYMMGNYQASIRDIEQTLELEPRHFGALAGLGLVRATLGQFEAALDAYQAALALNPHLSGVKTNVRLIRDRLQRGGP